MGFYRDSTLSRIDEIDELAGRAGVERDGAPLTPAAMRGTLSLDAVHGKRLSVVRPDHASIDWLAARYIEEMVPGAQSCAAEVSL